MSRQRHVYPTDEIPHLWAHQTQSDARNSRGNLFFEGPTIYSYGHHFPIASFVTSGKKKAVLFNSGRYSVTTSGHQSAVRSSVPASVPQFEVPNPTLQTGYNYRRNYESNGHTENLEHYRSNFALALEQTRKALKNGEYRLTSAADTLNELKAYAKFFKLKTGKLPKLIAGAELEKLRERWNRNENPTPEMLAKREHNAQVRLRSAFNAYCAKVEKYNNSREAWRSGETLLSAPYLKWRERRNFESAGFQLPEVLARDNSTMLRIKGGEVETSMGARVPIAHAKRALKFVQSVVESGQEYRRNGHTLHIGHYAIDRITPDGTLYAGCHVISFAEIQRIAPMLESVPETV